MRRFEMAQPARSARVPRFALPPSRIVLAVAALQLVVGLCLLGVVEGYKVSFFNSYIEDAAARQRGEAGKDSPPPGAAMLANPMDVRCARRPHWRMHGGAAVVPNDPRGAALALPRPQESHGVLLLGGSRQQLLRDRGPGRRECVGCRGAASATAVLRRAEACTACCCWSVMQVLNASRELVVGFFVYNAAAMVLIFHIFVDVMADTRECSGGWRAGGRGGGGVTGRGRAKQRTV
jgi:hypothetical protein